jgi:hypothetical protein
VAKTENKWARIIQPASLLLLVLISVAYVEGLGLLLPHKGSSLQAGFMDNSFNTNYSDFYQGFNLTSGWQIDWTIGQNSSAGMSCSTSYCVLKAVFSGQRQGLEISRSLGNLNTVNFPFLLITSNESTTNPDLAYSVAVIASDGSSYTGPFFAAGTTIHSDYVDLESLYQGPASRISVRLTDDLNPSYNGGIQSMTIYSMQFAASQPLWQPALSYVSNASVIGQNRVLTVSGTTDSSLPSGTLSIVSAQRSMGLNLDVTKYNIMSVELRTSTPGVIARIVVWNDTAEPITVFSGTIVDTSYQQVLIDLRPDHIGPTIYLVELSWMSPVSGTSFQMQYRNLAFYTNSS